MNSQSLPQPAPYEASQYVPCTCHGAPALYQRVLSPFLGSTAQRSDATQPVSQKTDERVLLVETYETGDEGTTKPRMI